MKHLYLPFVFVLTFCAVAPAQKGIDTQTEKIKKEGNKTVTRETDASRSFNWGKGKTEFRDRLPNPYKLAARRDVLVEAIVELLKENKMIVDEASSRLNDGVIITQPYVFAKGPVTAQSELGRYGNVPYTDTAWSRGRYTLTIEVQSIDGVQNNVYTVAKVEGRSGNGLTTEWTSIPSSGLAEDQFLSKLVEKMTGESLEPVRPPDNQ